MRRALLLALLAAGVGFVVWHTVIVHWVFVHTGVLQAGPDHYYNFWSGFGSDLGEATIVTGILAAYHHRNCHVRHCFRLGQPVQGTHYLACPTHHPEHPGKKRGVRVSDIHVAWKQHHKEGK